MCDAIFTFGQSGNHFFQCPSRRDYTRLPNKLQKLLSTNQIRQIHHVTLGFENSFLITWRDRGGEDHIDSHNLPQELTHFLHATSPHNTPLRTIPSIRLTLGPYNTSFFAHDGSSYLWLNLPPRLLAALQSRITNNTWHDRPRIVALGCADDFVLVTAAHAAVWQLAHFRALDAMLGRAVARRGGVAEMRDVVLHAYRYQCFIARGADGALVFENLPEHEVEGLRGMVEPLV
ncbi:hypothetical protein K505DRAFT_288884, partial [Melanomma pulvis-pyrius CBS 109.77]